MDFIRDMLLPETDAGVAVQLALVIAAWGLGFWLVRRRSEFRLVVLGIGLVTLGFIGVRAIH